MLRRWIPILSVAAIVLAAAEPASAGLRDRFLAFIRENLPIAGKICLEIGSRGDCRI